MPVKETHAADVRHGRTEPAKKLSASRSVQLLLRAYSPVFLRHINEGTHGSIEALQTWEISRSLSRLGLSFWPK